MKRTNSLDNSNFFLFNDIIVFAKEIPNKEQFKHVKTLLLEFCSGLMVLNSPQHSFCLTYEKDEDLMIFTCENEQEVQAWTTQFQQLFKLLQLPTTQSVENLMRLGNSKTDSVIWDLKYGQQ